MRQGFLDARFGDQVCVQLWYGELALTLAVVVMVPLGVVHTCWAGTLLTLSLAANFLDTKVPPPPLSNNALSVTGLGFPIRELNLTKAIGL